MDTVNCFLPPNLPGYEIMIISSSDAKFLYAEGRIRKFVLINPTAEKFNSAQNDILIFNV